MSAALQLGLEAEGVIAFRFPYDPNLVAAVRQIPGRRWQPAQKVWQAPITSAREILKLLERLPAGSVAYDSPEVETLLQSAANAQLASIEASRATDRTDVEIPAPPGLEYLPYQRAGIAYALARPSTLFGDEMGLGKTIQAIGTVNADASVKRVIVVCPASLKLNWKREIERWSMRAPLVLVGAGKPPVSSWQQLFGAWANRQREVEWLVINYDVIGKWHALLLGADPDVLVIDEAHYLKNPKAQRTGYVLGKWHRDPKQVIEPIPARRRLALTGTPIPNRPVEAWPLVHALAPETFKSWKGFVMRYCAGSQDGYGWDVTGASNLGELQEKLRGSIMVRRLKADVLTELPPKRRQVIEFPCDSNEVSSEIEAYQRMQEQLATLRAAVELAKACESEEEYRAAVTALREGATAAFTELSKLRHATALAKVPAVIEHLRECLDQGMKVICFAHHLDVIAAIREAFPEVSVEITGQTSIEDRQAAVDAFQKDEKIRLFVGNLRAAGVGLTLTASSHVVFAELDWVPGNVTQAEDRAHRIGQRESVLVQHLVLEGSLDADMARRLISKQAVIDAALDTEVGEVAAEPLLPLRAQEEAATEGTSRKQIAKIAESLAPETVAAIHSCLRILAGVCDGAMQIDGAGFNRMDTHIGKSLAGCVSLTPKQAALGQRLVRKYHRQLPPELLEIAKAEGRP